MSWIDYEADFPPVSTCLDGLEAMLAVAAAQHVKIGDAHTATLAELRAMYPDASVSPPPSTTEVVALYLLPLTDAKRRAAWTITARDSPLSIVLRLANDFANVIAPRSPPAGEEDACKQTLLGNSLLINTIGLRTALQNEASDPNYTTLLASCHFQLRAISRDLAIRKQKRLQLGPCGVACLAYLMVALPDADARIMAGQLYAAATRE